MWVNFYLGTHKNRYNERPIYVSIKAICAPRYFTTTGLTIGVDQWDKEAQRVKRGRYNAKKLSSELINAELGRIQLHFSNMNDRVKIYSVDELKIEMQRLRGKQQIEFQTKYTLSWLITQFMVKESTLRGWTEGTIKKFKTLSTHLERFCHGVTIDDVNIAFLQDFIRYLVNLGFKNSYIKKLCRILKWFLNWAMAQNYLSKDLDLSELAPTLKIEEKKVVFLDWNELMTLYKWEDFGTHAYLREVRDFFCFCCFTGLRYSDAAQLKKEDIRDGHIELVTQKDSELLRIPLNKYSQSILDRYAATPMWKNCALPVISNQKTNEYIKELGRLCGINTPIKKIEFRGSSRIEEVRPKYEYLTTHCGRKTFICAALSLGIPPQTVMSITGHSDYSAMKPYIAVAHSSLEEAMDAFDAKESPTESKP